MRLGIKVQLEIKDSGALRNEAWVMTEKSMTDDESIALLFAHPSTSKAMKVLAVDVQGSGNQRVVSIVADVRNKENLVLEANDRIASEGFCQTPITTPYMAFRELTVAMNNYTCRGLIGVSFDEGVQMNNSEIRRALERTAEQDLSI